MWCACLFKVKWDISTSCTRWEKRIWWIRSFFLSSYNLIFILYSLSGRASNLCPNDSWLDVLATELIWNTKSSHSQPLPYYIGLFDPITECTVCTAVDWIWTRVSPYVSEATAAPQRLPKMTFDSLPVWPDLAIFWTLGNFLKPLATINLPKSPSILRQFL